MFVSKESFVLKYSLGLQSFIFRFSINSTQNNNIQQSQKKQKKKILIKIKIKTVEKLKKILKNRKTKVNHLKIRDINSSKFMKRDNTDALKSLVLQLRTFC